jgi:GNAT superfamily N-acetyltransferase
VTQNGPFLRTEVVSFDDQRAVQLRDELGTELLALYATEEFPHLTPAARSALTVPPEEFLATVLAVTENGTPLGHAALRQLGEELEIKRVIVRPQARGHGVASALMSTLEKLAAEAGARRLILQTGDKQPEAVALYAKLGYTPIPVYPPYDKAIPFSTCFEKPLHPPK